MTLSNAMESGELMAMNLLRVLGVEVLMSALGTLAVLGLMWWVRRRWRARFREPFYQPMLRPPGWFCLQRREEAMFDVAGISAALPVSAMFIGILLSIPATRALGVAFAALGGPAAVGALWILRRRIETARTARLGFLGECAVAEALSPLSSAGWRIFHDVPMTGANGKPFNIDHVAIGPAGVYVIETKARSKPRRAEPGSDQARIRGETIELPDGSYLQPLNQAKGNAASLRELLAGEGAEIRWVEAVVALPGWNLSYPKDASLMIRDPRNLTALLSGAPPRLAPEKVEAVAAILDRQCRTMRFEEEDSDGKLGDRKP